MGLRFEVDGAEESLLTTTAEDTRGGSTADRGRCSGAEEAEEEGSVSAERLCQLVRRQWWWCVCVCTAESKAPGRLSRSRRSWGR